MTENQNIENKQFWRDEYLKWNCGLANAQGGVLVIILWRTVQAKETLT